MDAEWRENDYLWGRLDGAELILRTLRSSVDPTVPDITTTGTLDAQQAAGAAGQHLTDALSRILAAESDLHRIDDLRTNLAVQVAALKPRPAGSSESDV